MKVVAVAMSWLQADQRTPASHQSAQLWMEPRLIALQLRLIDQLAVVFSHISAPRS